MRTTLALLNLLVTTTLLAQTPPDEGDQKAYARSPREIAFQNDSQWQDNRWQQTDVGPFLAGTIATGKGGPTLKGIAIRVGDQGQAAVCFDTARLRISAAWTGDFLTFGAQRFGLIRPPAAGGKITFSTPRLAGWAKNGQFKPEPAEITIPEIEPGYTAPGASVTRLPKDWAHYRGLYTSGNRVVLSYSVGATDVLESPWFVQSGEHRGFLRSLEIGPSTTTMQMLVADKESGVTVIGEAAGVTLVDGRPELKFAPHDETVRVKVLITGKGVDAEAIAELREAAGDPEDLSRMINQDTGRYPDVLATTGATIESGGPYVIDTITLPFENPWKSLLFTAGHDFFSDGTAAICMAHGDIWTASGIGRDLKKLHWRRFATGLFQPLGLKVVDDKVYVIGRDQITRLHDRNRDGEADFYENFNNDHIIGPRAHDYVTCLDTDPEGNFYYIHAKTGVMKVSADGSTMTSIADGFRNPNGMGVSPDGTVTASPQQGTWTPESSLIVVKEGGYYGFGGPRVTDDRPAGWDLPMCFIPRAMDNSGGGQVWVEGNRWGPLEGQMLHLSYGQCRFLLAIPEDVDGVIQGGTIKFPTTPGDFESGIMRGRFNPHDGQLYVSGLRGWQTRAIRDGCFQRVRYTGGPVHLPVAVKTYSNGIKLTFSEPLDREMAENADNFFVEQWNYLWSKEYGSPEFSVANPNEQGRDEVPVVSATLMDQGHAVFLEMPSRHAVNQISIHWLLESADGEAFRGEFAHTINSEPRETIPESQIVRRERTSLITDDVVKRLKPGLLFQFQSSEGHRTNTGTYVASNRDYRTSRLLAIRQPIDAAPTPFVAPGPFKLLAGGTLRIPLSGFYDFKIQGTGDSRLIINGKQIIKSSAGGETSAPVLLRKGHNHIGMIYTSPQAGIAELRLLWKGYNFAWEPVPPDALFHDSGRAELIDAQQRRLGRQLFAEHRCASCHLTDVGQEPMFEISLPAPDLTAAGDRLSGSWLAHWMLSPSTLRPDTHMPAVLGEGDEAKQAAADIAAFMKVAFRAANDAPIPPASDLDGAALYETLGCTTCHHFHPPEQVDDFDRLSLHYVGAKYLGDGLAQFLRDPTAHHKATRMPDFRLSEDEADALARFVRSESKGTLSDIAVGDVERGKQLFSQSGCLKCHGAGESYPRQRPQLPETKAVESRGCLAKTIAARGAAPAFAFAEDHRRALTSFLKADMTSLARSDAVETSQRIVERLRCASCHDRDGKQSHRTLVIAEEGSGRLPEVLPSLSWAGEKFQPAWTEKLLAGKLEYKSRPWIVARMPAFPAYATQLAHGLAAEHGIDAEHRSTEKFDPELAKIGEQLTLQTGLDCRQCHAIGDLQPRGDKDTKIALGVNFTYVRDRLRHDAYHRFMLDPPRYDINTKMIKLSENGLTTKLKAVFDADAHKQFDAVWHYIQSLPGE